jgi:hypothetical protein
MLACLRVLTHWTLHHRRVLLDLLSFAVIGIGPCSNNGRRDTPWSKKMTQQVGSNWMAEAAKSPSLSKAVSIGSESSDQDSDSRDSAPVDQIA